MTGASRHRAQTQLGPGRGVGQIRAPLTPSHPHLGHPPKRRGHRRGRDRRLLLEPDPAAQRPVGCMRVPGQTLQHDIAAPVLAGPFWGQEHPQPIAQEHPLRKCCGHEGFAMETASEDAQGRRGQTEPLTPTKPSLTPGIRHRHLPEGPHCCCLRAGWGAGGTAGTCSALGLGCLHRHKQEKAVLTEVDTDLVFTVFF